MEGENKEEAEENSNEETAEKIVGDMIEKKSEKSDRINKFKKNPWMITALILAILCVIFLTLILKPGISGRITGNVIAGDTVANNLVQFLSSRVGSGIEVQDVEDMGNLYEVIVSYQNDTFPLYVTKDGKYFVQGLVPLITESDLIKQQGPIEQNIPKSDKPEVNLFVMTYCPYGTQAEKGFIPAIKALGDKIDANIRFVHYFMHGAKEEQETYKQVCIREEQEDKYLSYLSCFLEDGDTERCLDIIGVDKDKLNDCIKAGRNEEYYKDDSALSEAAGVRGSPTLVINGQIVQSSRSPADYLSTICSTFNTAPSECTKELSTQTYNPGFGYEQGAATSAQC